MNRKAAKKLVAECSADAKELDRDDYNVGIEALFHALVAARLAPEQKPVVEFAAAFGAAPDLPEPRPSYVPEGAPWEWTKLASGERVAMWTKRDGGVWLGYPPDLSTPWRFTGRPRVELEGNGPIGPTALAAVEAFGRKHGIW